ncbi:MAG: hypothetical protein DWQ45_26120 [Planctomycetota bacterium]|nr:MAG: hypothetical protein DWQ41_27100 [Planctomycetota bacterium]REK27557.1 MAG: hypothetical protein DWQ45_26120 [Planctomycetota bacterium]
MSKPHIPAADRDLANEDPHVPPASRQTSTFTNNLFGSLVIGFGIAVIVMAIVAAIFNVSPLPRDLYRADEVMAAVWAMLAGLCLVGCGVTIMRRGTVWPLVMLVAAIICGFLSSAFA